MKKAQHTPGPWHSGKNPGVDANSVFDAQWRVVAQCINAANSPLIASAPDLLVALKNLVETVDNNPDWDGIDIPKRLEEAIAVIAKGERNAD